MEHQVKEEDDMAALVQSCCSASRLKELLIECVDKLDIQEIRSLVQYLTALKPVQLSALICARLSDEHENSLNASNNSTWEHASIFLQALTHKDTPVSPASSPCSSSPDRSSIVACNAVALLDTRFSGDLSRDVFSMLPLDILLKLCSFFDATTLCRFTQTCKRFYNIAKYNSVVWKNLYKNTFCRQASSGSDHKMLLPPSALPTTHHSIRKSSKQQPASASVDTSSSPKESSSGSSSTAPLPPISCPALTVKHRLRSHDSTASSKQGKSSIYGFHVPETPKRTQVSKACSNCRTMHAACGLERPCKRCVDNGLEQTCFDVPRKKRVSRKRALAESAASSQPLSQIAKTSSSTGFSSQLHSSESSTTHRNAKGSLNHLLSESHTPSMSTSTIPLTPRGQDKPRHSPFAPAPSSTNSLLSISRILSGESPELPPLASFQQSTAVTHSFSWNTNYSKR